MLVVKRKTIMDKNSKDASKLEKSRSHVNDPFVLKKVEEAKAFISKAGLPHLTR